MSGGWDCDKDEDQSGRLFLCDFGYATGTDVVENLGGNGLNIGRLPELITA
jgi:hypothetical protein